MSLMPMGNQMSPRDFMLQLAASRFTQDGTEQNTSTMLLTDIAARSAENIGRTVNSSTERSVDSVQRLIDLGFDKDDPTVKQILAANAEVTKVLLNVADQIPRLIRPA